MKRVLVVLLAVFGALCVLVALGAIGIGLIGKMSKGTVPSKTILEVDLEQGFPETVPDDPIAQVLMSKQMTLRDVVEALQRAGDDDRVTALVARVGAAPMGVAQVQEIRDAIAAFRAKGKSAVAYAETFGEFGPGNSSYYLATAFDTIYLQPSGDIGLTGIMLESPFIRGTLDKLGVVPRMDHRYEYKNAMNLFTEKKFTEPHREAMKGIVDGWYGQIVKGISETRKLSEAEVKSLVDRGPFLGKEALDAKLVDALAYRDEVYAKVKEKAQGAKLLYLGTYFQRAGSPNAKGTKIALIYGVGAVTRGPSNYDAIGGSQTMGSDTVAAAFRAAIADKDVKAILFRVDSPGGSYVASDAIWRETVRAKEAGKPVIVSMGDLAGSGGYFVAMDAAKIVAQPGTITASIGVLGGKLYRKELWEKIGLTFDEVHSGENAGMWSATIDYSPAGWQRFETWLDRVYEDFTSKVAKGRNLPKEKVLQIAKGRIWTGEDALGLGLVDELGGYPKALSLAKKAAGVAEDAKIDLVTFPKRKTPFEALFGQGPDSSDQSATVKLLARVIEVARPVAKLAARLGLTEEAGVLEMPPLEPAR
jgi:protease-4